MSPVAVNFSQMVEVFKTNVQQEELAETLVRKLLAHFPHHRINFDLEDCDKILRVEGQPLRPEKIIEVMSSSGYECSLLE